MKPPTLDLLASVALAALDSTAVTKSWNGCTTGSWQLSSNWIPAGAPVNGDALIFTNTATKLPTT